MNRLDLLRPEARELVKKFLESLDAAGYKYAVLETQRTQALQDAYYAQGRKSLEEINKLREMAGEKPIEAAEAQRIVTNATHSVHQDGLAADIVPVLDNGKIPWDYAAYKELWLAFGNLGIKAGLKWGGEWKPLLPCGLGWDPPHYQTPK